MKLLNVVRFAGLLVAVAGGAPCAPAAVIYQDSLTGSGSELNGTAVDVSTGLAGGTPDATWQAEAGVTKTGSGATYGAAKAAFLPIAVESGRIYTLTATVQKASGNEYVALGFARGPIDLAQEFARSQPCAWMAYYVRGKGPLAFAGPTFSGQRSIDWGTNSGGPETITIELDTTDPAWKATFTLRGQSTTSTYAKAYSVASNFTHVGFGTRGGGENLVRNFSLSASTPATPSPNN